MADVIAVRNEDGTYDCRDFDDPDMFFAYDVSRQYAEGFIDGFRAAQGGEGYWPGDGFSEW